MPPNYKFALDNEIGTSAEEFVLNILINNGFQDAHRVDPGFEPRWDIVIPSINKTIEVKDDQESNRTKNVCIEMGRNVNDKIIATGIMVSEANFWTILACGSTYILDKKGLKEYVIEAEKNKLHRIVMGGDRNVTKMMLINIDIFKTLPFVKELNV